MLKNRGPLIAPDLLTAVRRGAVEVFGTHWKAAAHFQSTVVQASEV